MNGGSEDIMRPHTESAPPDPTKPGYSKAMLEQLNAGIKLLSPRTVIKQGNLDAITKASAEIHDATEKEKLKFESVAIAAHFIPPIWMSMLDWLQSNNTDLALPENGQLVTFSDEEIKQSIHGRPLSPDNLVQMIIRKIEKFFISRYLENMRNQAKKEDFGKTEEGKLFIRWQELLRKRSKSRSKEEMLDPESHLTSTMEQANDIVWSLFRTIPKIYQKQYPDRVLQPQEREQLIHNARVLVSTIASCNPVIAKKIFETINPGGPVGTFQAYDNYAVKFFRFLEAPNGKKSLEFDPSIFKIIEHHLETPEARQALVATTRCPALYVTGRNGRNLVADFYDWNASLYLKYCVKE